MTSQRKRSRRSDYEGRRRLLLERLEDRRLLAVGPRLAGVQPNNSDLFSFVDQSANVRDVAPRELTLRFDENQQIDPSTLSAIQIVRSINGILGDGDDQLITPGFIGVGKSPSDNEVVIRFAESLPDELYQIQVFGGADPNGLKNLLGDTYIPTLVDGDGNANVDSIRFELDLGAQVVAVVPQPVSRDATGSLVQARNQIEVYFNDDDLFIENDDLGNPTQASAENPEFYQLIFTADTVRNTDDVVVMPIDASYDAARDLVTLTFAEDLDALHHPDTGALIGPGTFRLRVGSDEAAPLPPQQFSSYFEVSSDFNSNDQVVLQFTAVRPDEHPISVVVNRSDLGAAADAAPRVLVNVVESTVFVSLNSHAGEETTAAEVVAAINGDPVARQLIGASINSGNPATKVGDRPVNYSPLDLIGLGSSFNTATNLTDETDIGPAIVVTGSGNAFVDGQFFEITDASGTLRKFEFDRDVPTALNDSASIAIAFTENATQSQLGLAIVQAINGASFDTTAILAGNRILLEGDDIVDMGTGVAGLAKEFQNRFDAGQVLRVSLAGDSFTDGQRFTVTDRFGVTKAFEFDFGFILEVPQDVAADLADADTFSITDRTGTTVIFEFEDVNATGAAIGVSGTNVEIRFDPTADTQQDVTDAVIAAIQGRLDAQVIVGIAPFDLGGGRIHIGNSPQAVDTTGGGLTDTGTPLVQTPGATPIEFIPHASFTSNAVALAIGNAINAAGFAVVALPASNQVRLDNDKSINVDVPGLAVSAQGRFDAGPVLTVTKDWRGFVDGQTIQIRDDRGTVRDFEFDNEFFLNISATSLPADGDQITLTHRTSAAVAPSPLFVFEFVNTSTGGTLNSPDNVAVNYTDADDQADIVNALLAAFDGLIAEGRLAGLSLVNPGDGRIQVGAGPGYGFTITGTAVVQSGPTLNDPNAVAVTFTGGQTLGGAPLMGVESISEMAGRLAEAVNFAGFRGLATAVEDRIYLTNDRQVILDGSLDAITKTSQGIIISSAINPQPFNLDFPGANNEPGHRDIPKEVGSGIQQHINSDFAAGGRDATPGVTTILYNFRDDYGVDQQGLPLQNAITEQQKARAREAFQLWGNYLGVQFLESAREGLAIATGDVNALSTLDSRVLDFAANDFRVRIDPRFADGLLVMDNSIQWNEDFGENWFVNSMVGIGAMLGLDLANDLPTSNVMALFTAPVDPITGDTVPYFNVGDPEPIYPGSADIIHGQELYRLDGIDIDLYRFTIDLDEGRVGRFTAETFAERLPNSSLLDTVIRLYRENPNGTRELISQNDDYFSRDSLIEMDLGPGVYYIGVSASGNSDYDPTIEGTGIGGASQGVYDLRLNFRSQVEDENTIRDLDGQKTALDGDADGATGGVYNFWFQTRPLNRVLEISGDGSSFQDGQILTITNSQGVVKRFEFDSNNSFAAGNVRVPFTTTTTPEFMAQTLVNEISSAGFNVNATADPPGSNRLKLTGERAVSLSFGFVGLEIEGKTIFVDKTAGPNADGSLQRPFNNIARSGQTNAFAATHPDDIVRIVGNGGTDLNIDTLGDNFAYEVGFGTAGGPAILNDGTELAVPRGVTVMVDPGTIFKMRRSRIGVGSSSLTVDRGGGAFQALGTPERNVYFTSWLNENIGFDSHPTTTAPARGDWGGIVFRADVDDAESRANLEEEAIFLNYVNHADISYGGGGNVVIDGVQQIVNPIQLIKTRPTISFNRITNSPDSAMSASPNSFEETNFHSPRFQAAGVFTSDYERIGPDIHSNFLINNSTNGLFVRIETPAGNVLRPLTVSGRFDDTDIVHVIAENLVIQGSQGDPLLDLERPAIDLITFTPRNGGGLPEGVYNYKVTFVDANGFEGRPSTATADFTITAAAKLAGIGSIQLNQLPPVTGDFVSRRIYRTDANSDGVYRLVAALNASDTVFVDRLAPGQLQDELRRDPPSADGVTAVPQQRGSLAVGRYNYRIVFVDAQGNEGASSDPFADIVNLGVGSEGGIALDNLPAANNEFVSRRLYRSTIGGIAPYTLVAELDATSPSYIDDGFTLGGTLDPSAFGVIRARPHARLAIDPGTVVKLEGARIETKFGGQLIAEGKVGQEVIFTSRLDDAFGAGGTFDTNDDDNQTSGEASPTPGNWGGLFFGQLSRGSIDNALIAYGGGINKIEGTFAGFNVIEVHQADFRLTNSIVENNAEGVGGQGPIDRFGRGYNRVATIFVRGAQPIIVDNIFRDNNTLYAGGAKSADSLQMPVITINANSLIHDNLVDYGRSRGAINVIGQYGDNAGPLVRGNRLSNNALNAMVIRGEVLTTQSVWDDSDIVHVVTNQFDQRNSRTVDAAGRLRTFAFDEIVIPEHHTFGGLRLESNATESLVVKLRGPGQLDNNFNLTGNGGITNANAYDGAGFTAGGRLFEIDDRIGGTLHILGQPGFPVVLTSLFDDTVGAGVQPDDRPQTDTNNDGIATIPRPNDWRSVRLDQNSNDRNVEIVLELEPPEATAPGVNATTDTAQLVGSLAENEQGGDENLRMGFEIQGFINEPNDVDVYAFGGVAGTEVWLDIDRTTFTLDTIIEFLDSNGNVVARSDDTLRESESVDFVSNLFSPNVAAPLQKSPTPYYPTHASGLPKDFFSLNPRDAGMRIALPGNAGTTSTYHIRVRSRDGLTSGVYQFQIRMREIDEFPGSTVRFADIRYANNGVEVIGLPRHSPLLGEAAEDELAGSFASNDNFLPDLFSPGIQPQDIGNLLASDRAAISVAGTTSNSGDVDFFKFDVAYEGISAPSQQHAATTFDVDYADALVRYNSTLSVFNSNGVLILLGQDSNIAEDRSGPLAGANLDDLSRGSVGPKDPFIGPVELPQGTYYATVTSNGQTPSALNSPFVRLEPVNSVIRIAEDHIGSFGGSTAADPVVPVLLDPTFVGTGTNLWHVTSNRASNPGHGLTNVFDLSRSGAALNDGGESFYFGDERAANTVPAGSMGSMLSNPFGLKGYSAADRPVIYFNYFVDNDPGSDTFRVSIVDAAGNATPIASSNSSESASPNVTPLLQTGFGFWRQARIELDAFAGMDDLRLQFDYDGVSSGSNEGAYVDDIVIGFAERGEMVTGAATNTGFSNNSNAPAGEIHTGDYQLEIRKASEFGSSGDFVSSVRGSTVWGVQPSTGQIVQINPASGAIVGQFPAPDALSFGHLFAGLSIAENGNSLIYNNTHTDTGILYRLNPTTGAILSTEVLPTSTSGSIIRGGLSFESGGTIFVQDASNGVDAQAGFGGPLTQHLNTPISLRGALGGDGNGRQFVADSNLSMIIEYDPGAVDTIVNRIPSPSFSVAGLAFDGINLYASDSAGNLFTLDPDDGTVLGTVTVAGGDLIALGAARASNANIGLTLTGSIDTNARDAQATTLIAPAGTEVVNGQTFKVSDGVNSLTFEYEDPEIGDGITGGNVEIRFKTLDTNPASPTFGTYLPDSDSVIARRIRDAINSPQAQTILKLRAAKSDGEVTGAASTDNRVNLFGSALVDVPDSFEITATTNNANQLRDVIVNATAGSPIQTVGNATFVGSDVSAGLFRGGMETIGLESGIVLTTGNANFADDPNPLNTQSGRASQRGDADLDAEFGVTTSDTTSLEFDFMLPPGGGDLYLNFVFASEEYNESIGSLFADAVAIFVDEGADGVDVKNIALVPGASLSPVSIDTVNGGQPFDPTGASGTNPQFYNNNDPNDGGLTLDNFGYDGFTDKFVASLAGVNALASPGPHRIKIAISDVGDLAADSAIFLEANSLVSYPTSDPNSGPFVRGPVGIASIRHEGQGDQNRFRDQGQVIIHSNTITDSKNFGIVADAGDRATDGSFAGVPVRLQSPVPGPVRNLVVPNNVPGAGGFAPGVVIVNNTLTSDGSLGGIHVSGTGQTHELTILRPLDYPNQNTVDLTAGDRVCDGTAFSIRAFGETVVFEFEDIAGSPVPCGNDTAGGDGWVDGRIPIYYRRSVGNIPGFTQAQMAATIKASIDASLLVTNDSTLVAQTYIFPSRSGAGGPGPLGPGPLDPAVYVDHASSIGGGGFHRIRVVGHAFGPQPFARVVNNTVFGNDGDFSFFPDPSVEPNDTLFNAIDTRQGRQHNPETYTATSTIGDTQNFREDKSVDVDFYKFQLDIGDRVTVNIAAITNGSSLNPVLRLFNQVGEELDISRGDLPTQTDPFIDFTATANGTYYVAVSGAGNETYSPLSLGSRSAPASTGPYDIDINVRAPRTYVITASHAGNGTFDIEDVNGNIRTAVITSPATDEFPMVASRIAQVINGVTGGTNSQSLPNGPFPNASPLRRISAQTYGGGGLYNRFVVVRNAARITRTAGNLAITPVADNDLDQILQERGILVSEQATPTVVNNVLTNLRRGLEQVSFQASSLGPADVGRSVPGGMVEGASVYQHNSLNDSNIPFSSEDFQISLPGANPLYVNAPNHNLYPANFALSIDSSVDSLQERDEFESIKEALGISQSPILAPDRDAVGQLRVNDPDVQTPSGQGANVFKDRGSLDRSDFVGPSASLVFPQDNDAGNLDLDGAASIVQLNSGVYSNFTIQIVDGFEAADPFPGVGVDDNTLDGRVIPIDENGIPLLVRGPALTLFRDGVFLREGIDYTFRYNQTSNEAVLTPLSGIWQSGVYVIRVNNRDRFVIDAAGGDQIADGDDFTITNANGETASVEFDSGYTVSITETLGLQVPAIGAAIGGITDGQRFVVIQDSGATAVTFEFDRNGNVLPGNRPVPFATGDSADVLADKIAAALQQAVTDGALTGLLPRNLGNGLVHVGATPDHEVDVTFSQLTTTVTQFPFSLTVPANGGLGLTDGETFMVSDGTTTETFEFDNNGVVNTVPPGCTYCTIPYLDPNLGLGVDSADDIAGLLASALAAAPLGLNPVSLGGGVVELGAGPNHTVDVTGGSLTRQMFIGGVNDGERFTLTNGVDTVTFEFDNDNVFIDQSPADGLPDNILLTFTTTDTHLDLADQMVAAIIEADLGLDPIHIGGGVVNLGGTSSHVLTTVFAPSLSVTGEPGVRATTTLHLPTAPALQVPVVPNTNLADISDGQSFILGNGSQFRKFEFDSDNMFQTGNVVITFNGTETQTAMANTISMEIFQAGLGFNPMVLTNGVVDLGAPANALIDLTNSSLTRADRVGTSLLDGDVFSINDGTNTVFFEFDDSSLGNGVAPNNEPILFTPGSDVDTVADTMVAVIRSAGIGLLPVNQGAGAVELKDSPAHLVDISLSALTRSGVPGGGVAVVIRSNFSDAQVAAAIVDSINLANVALPFEAVTAKIRGGSTLFVDIDQLSLDDVGNVIQSPADYVFGTAAVTGIPNFFLSAVKDLPGNPLKSNQATDETQFTILLPGTKLDFGDAPDPFTGTGRYATLFENDGARHVITENPIFLGSGVDADVDGQPTLASDGDDADHVFSASSSNLSVTGTAPFSILVPAAGGAAISDGDTFTITRFTGASVTFQFDITAAPGDQKINFTPGMTRDDIANAIVEAILRPANNNQLVLQPANLGDGVVFIGGQLRHSVDAGASSIVVEGAPASLLRIPATPAGFANVRDGDRIVFNDGSGSVTFEFDNDATFTAGNTPVAFVDTETPAQVAINLVAAVQASGLGFVGPAGSMTHQGNGVIQLAGPSTHTLDISLTPSLSPAGRIPLRLDTPATGLAIKVPAILQLQVPAGAGTGNGIQDGDVFSINDRIHPVVTFEFDRVGGVVTPGARRIPFSSTQSPDTVAARIVQEVQQAVTDGSLAGLQPTNLGGGLVDLAPTAIISVDSRASQLVQTGPVAVGDTFQIDLDGPFGVRPFVVFEFAKTGAVSGTNRRVQLQDVQSADGIANAIVTALKNAALAGDLPGVTASNLGSGIVDVSGPASLVTDLTGSPNLTSDGTPGGLADGQLFTISDGGRVTTFEFDRNNRFTAGNQVVSTVIKVPGQLPSEWVERTVAEMGAEITRAINAAGLAMYAADLGGGSVQLQTDDEDGVQFGRIFTPGAATPITVTASAAGILNAWFDWNQDGDWNDPNEQVFTDVPLRAGLNTLSVTVPNLAPLPSTLPLGLTAARFRFSSETGLLPTGLAVNGEVEDYQVRVIRNSAPVVVQPGIPDLTADEDALDLMFDAASFFNDVNITDGSGDYLIYRVVDNDNPSLIDARVGLDGHTLVLDFLDDQNGFANIRVRATDQGGLFVEDTFLVTVTPLNDPPVAMDQTVTLTEVTTEDLLAGGVQPITVTLEWDDGDPMADENQLPNFAIDADNSNGTVTLAPDFASSGVFTYIPDADFNTAGGRTATLTFHVSDRDAPGEDTGFPPTQTSPIATVTFLIAPVNGPPVGDASSVTTDEELPVNITLTGNDGDPHPEEIQTITFAIVDQPAGGTLAGFNPLTGAVTYTPNLNFNGQDTFTFSITDDDFFGPGTTRTGEPTVFTVNVTPINDPPVANNLSFSVDENSNYDSSVSGNQSLPGADGDPEVVQVLSYRLLSGPSHGTVTLLPNTTGAFIYTPAADYNGPDSFTYDVTDDAQAGNPVNQTSGAGVVSITVLPTNEKPIANPQTTSTDEDDPVDIVLTADDNDPDVTQVLTYSIVSLPGSGTITNFDAATGLLTYTPDPDFNGIDTFTFRVQDDARAGNPANLFSDPATVTINVAKVNDAPIANDLSISLREDQVYDSSVSGNLSLPGEDGDPEVAQVLTYQLVSGPAHGTVTLLPNTSGAFIYTPAADYNGPDTFTYRVTDDAQAGAPAALSSTVAGRVNISISPVNDAPVFNVGPDVTVNEDAGQTTIIGWAQGVRPGPVTAVDETPQTVTFTVTNNNNPLFLQQPAISSSGTLTFTPAPNANGSAVVQLFARDNGSGAAPNVNQTATTSFIITVNAVNDAPQFAIGLDQVINEDAGLRVVPNWVPVTSIRPGPASAQDEAGQDLTFNIVSVSTTGNLAFLPNLGPEIDPSTGTLTYQTAPHTNGVATVTVTLSDDGDTNPPNVNVSAPQTFKIRVGAINDPPEFTVGAPVEVDEDAGFTTVAGWARDILPGPSAATDESSQTITFVTSIVNLTGGLTFTSLPAIDAGSGDLTFQTAADKFGVATVSVRAIDSGNAFLPHVNASAPQIFAITVNSVNDAPEFTLIGNQRASEDAGPQQVQNFVTGIRGGPPTATDEVNQPVTFNVTNDANGLFSVQPVISPDGTLTYTPFPNANGAATVTVQAIDPGSNDAPNVNQSTQTFTLTIDPVNDAPTISVPGQQVVNEDTVLPVRNISVADIDAGEIEVKFRVNNGVLTVNTGVAGGLQPGDVSNNGTGTVTVRGAPAVIRTTLADAAGLLYQGNLNFNGNDVLTVTADDLGNTGSPGKKTAQATIPIIVVPVNDAPVVVNPISDIQALEDSANLRIELFPRVFNDPDVATNNDVLTLTVMSNSSPNVVSATIDGTALVLALVPNQFGNATIEVKATDRLGASATNSFTLFVASVNDAPVANPDSHLVVKNTPTNLNVLGNDTDVEGDNTIDVTSVEITSAANNASLLVNGDGTIRFTPSPNFLGVSTFRYRVKDNQGAQSNETTVTVRVISPPTARDDAATTTESEPVAINVLQNDTDTDGTLNKASIVIRSGPSSGSVNVDSNTGVVTYTPQGSFNGTDVFRYTVDDFDGATSNQATVTITVDPIRHWQNPGTAFPRNELDVNADGQITPQDVLIVINQINRVGGGPLPTPTPGFHPPPFYDANGDGFLTANDALVIINYLNAIIFGGGEGEGPASHDVAGFIGGEGEAVAGDRFAVTASPGLFEIHLPEREAREVEAGLRGDRENRSSVDQIMADLDDAMAPLPVRPRESAAASRQGMQVESTLDVIAGDLVDRFYDRDANDSVFGEDVI